MIGTKKYTIDLHTHSTFSYDGGISAEEYARILNKGVLDYVAITDHHEIKLAQKLHHQLGDKIIVGEEIMTQEGEMIGLFLVKTIPSGFSAEETADRIHTQGGLVYIPHPFETRRKGLNQESLEKIIAKIDIFEVFNGRAFFQNKSDQARAFATKHKFPTTASSDAHGYRGIGTAYASITEPPKQNSLKALLMHGERIEHTAPLHSLLYPTIHKMKHNFWQS